jgi:4-azaleucine resistance transporter AzlC
MLKSTFKKAFFSTIPVMAGYLVMGMALGILMEEKGYGFLWSGFMSLTVYAGSMEFVAVELLSTGSSLISAAVMTLLVNARHLFYGLSLLDKYGSVGKIKPYLIFGLTDETYALVCNGAPEGTEKKWYYFFVTILDHCYWICGSMIGGMLGAAITFDTTGIDFAMTALFVVIFTEQCLSTKDHVPALIGVGATVLCLVIFGVSNFLIPSMLLITVLLLLLGVVRDRKAVSK